MVKDIRPGYYGSYPGYLTDVDGTLFWNQDMDGDAFVTLDYACMGCHIDIGEPITIDMCDGIIENADPGPYAPMLQIPGPFLPGQLSCPVWMVGDMVVRFRMRHQTEQQREVGKQSGRGHRNPRQEVGPLAFQNRVA